MNHLRLAQIIAVLGVPLVPVVATGLPAAGQVTEDQCAIAYGDTVAHGTPGPGAGNIEVGGAQDAYTFAAMPDNERERWRARLARALA